MSLLDIADTNRRNAMGQYGALSQMEGRRNQFNDQMKAQRTAQQASALSGGISTGIMAGSVFGGPAGIAIGAGVALLGGLF